MEEELGVILFTRNRRGMELTQAGQNFLVHAYGIISQYSKAKESLLATESNPHGSVSVAMTASVLTALTLPLAEKLKSEFPNITLSLEVGLAGTINQALDAGEYDLVISHLVKPDKSIKIEPLIKEDLFLSMPFSFDIPEDDIPFSKLEGFELITPRGRHGVAADIGEHAKRLGMDIKRAQIVGALGSTLQMISAGYGSSILPWSAIHNHIERKLISARKIVNPELHHTINMVYPTHRPLTQAILSVMNIIRQSVQEVHARGLWAGKILI